MVLTVKLLGRLVTASDAMECLKICKSTDSFQCKWYTFRGDNSLNCELFESCEVVNDSFDCGNCISGEVTCPSEFCDKEGLCLGKLVSTEQQFYQYVCDLHCQEDPNCKYYSFENAYPSKADCYLLETCSSLDESVTNFKSSQAGCPLNN